MLGFGLAWACTGHINANIIPGVCMCSYPMWSEDTVSLWSSTTYGSYSLSTPSSTIIPNPWEKACDKTHLGLRIRQSLLFPAPWATTGLYFRYLLLWWKIHFCCCDKTPWLKATLKKKYLFGHLWEKVTARTRAASCITSTTKHRKKQMPPCYLFQLSSSILLSYVTHTTLPREWWCPQ